MRNKNIKKRVMTFIVISLILFSHLSVLGESEQTNQTDGVTYGETITDGTTDNTKTTDGITNNTTITDGITNTETIINDSDDIKNISADNELQNVSIVPDGSNRSIEDDNLSVDKNYSVINDSEDGLSINDTDQKDNTVKTNITDTMDNSTEFIDDNITLSSETTNGDSGGGGGTYDYIHIENVSRENNTNFLPQAQTNDYNVSEKIYTECSLAGNPNDGYAGNITGCNDIFLSVTIENDSEKKIIINSTFPVNESIRIFTEINKININDTGSVKIYWMNNNQEEMRDKVFYDTDNDGYYEKVSWYVPHLSEQIFKVIINYTKIEDMTKNNIGLDVTSPINNSIIQNPVQFNYNMLYKNLSNIQCTLAIDGSSSLDTINMYLGNKSFVWPQNLANGAHSWLLLCSDRFDNAIENSSTGSFIINENFSSEIGQNIYLIGENVSIKIYSKNNTDISLISPDNNKIFNNLVQGQYPKELILDSSNFTKQGAYILNITSLDYFAKQYSWQKNINMAKINLTKSKQNISISESIDYIINIDSPIANFCYSLYYGDNNQTSECPQTNMFQKTISYKYQGVGSFTPRLDVTINNRTFSQIKNTTYVTNPYDTEKPTLTLLGPDDDSYIKNATVIFSYRSADNIKLNNCTFSLYRANGTSWSYSYAESDLITRNINSTLKNNEQTIITLNSLPEKNYFWEVSCFDNSSNNQKDERFLTINLTNSTTITSSTASTSTQSQTTTNDSVNYTYEQKTDLTNTLTLLNDFIKRQETYSLDQKEVLDDLGISKELDYYNKRLNQIDQDLGYNLKYVEDSAQREKRKQELIAEYRNISRDVPKDIQIVQEKEFVKNSLSLDLETFLKEYLRLNNEDPSKAELKKIAEENFKIQNNLELSIKLRQVKIEYKDSTKQMTLVSKSIELKNDTIKDILEVIPKDIANKNKVMFITPTDQLNDSGIYHINIAEIENNKIIYSLDGFVDLKELEKTDTLLYQEYAINNLGITGFSILEFQVSDWSYIIAFIFFGLVISFLFFTVLKRKRIANWKKEENVVKLFSLIKEGKRSIRKEDIETAKEKYHNIRKIYPYVPKGCKRYTLKDIKSIQECIDKKDINDLVKEYETAKKEKRSDDANKVYEKIKDNYKKLPKKDRLKVKKKLFE